MLPHFLFALYGVPHNIAPRNSRDVGVADVVLEPSGQCVAVVVADVAKKFQHYTAVEFLLTGVRIITFRALLSSIHVLSTACSAIKALLPLVTSPLQGQPASPAATKRGQMLVGI